MTCVAVVAMLGVGLTGCDGHHDPLDTSMKVGHILCTDGKTRSYEDYVASDKEAIAVVFHVNSEGEVAGTGYAVYLHDLAPEAFADSIGVSQGTSADLTAYDGNPYIEACGGDLLPDEADGCWYWTSTEVEGQETAKAWLYSMGSGAMQETPKLQAHKVRAMVTLYNEE